MAKIVMGAKKKELGAWCKNGREDREHKWSHNPVKSASRMMSTREQQHLVKQIKHVVVLRNDHILMFCVVQSRAHILKLFQRSTYALPSFSHFPHFIANA